MSEELVVKNFDSIPYATCNCPHSGCGEKNYVYLGRLDDSTAPTVEAMECWNCERLSWLPDGKEEAEINETTLADAYVEAGRMTLW